MNYVAFYNRFQTRELLFVNDVLQLYPNFDTSLLVDWQKKGYIQKLINRYYTWSDKLLSEGQQFFVANQLYSASYISLKSALRYYNFIPEGVYQHFSVSSRKTKYFATPTGNFYYKNIKQDLFYGYKPAYDGKTTFLIAEPEKAIFDTLYLTPHLKDKWDIEGLRLNYDMIKEICEPQKMLAFAHDSGNKRVTKLTKIIIEQMP